MSEMVVVTLNWNGCEALYSFLPSVVRCPETEGTKIYMADNGSTDAFVEMLRQELPPVHPTILDKNRGSAESYSLALQQVSTECVALLDSDVEVIGHRLAPLMDYMDAHLEIVACQPKTRSWWHKERFEYAGATSGFIDRYGYPFHRGWIMGAAGEGNGQCDTVVPVFWVTGAALFIRLKDYQDTGRLDGHSFAHMGEIGPYWRLCTRGQILTCVPQSTVYHIGGATLKKENPHRTLFNFRNNLIILYKNLSEEELDYMIRVRAVSDCVVALSFPSKGQFANMRAVLRTRRASHSFHPLFAAGHEENLKKTFLPVILEQMKSSVLM